MSSTFDNLMAGATDTFLLVNGEDITIDNSGNGTESRTIKGIFTVPFENEIDMGSTSLQFRRMYLEISARNNTTGVVSPKIRGKTTDSGGMKITRSGDAATWYVIDVKESDAGMHKLEIVDNDGVVGRR